MDARAEGHVLARVGPTQVELSAVGPQKAGSRLADARPAITNVPGAMGAAHLEVGQTMRRENCTGAS